MGFNSIKKSVLKKIVPSSKEEKEEIKLAEKIKQKLSKNLPKNYLVRLTGSVSKGTFLKNSADLDIFVLVPKKVNKNKLLSIMQKAVKKSFPKNKSVVKYAEHPYIRLEGFGRKVDVVPAYNITYIEEMASAVDRSVLHTGYIRGNLKPEQKNEVRLLKQFLKVHDLYGAEIRVQGFSGYLCELLIIKYGNFLNLLKNVEKWTFPIVIDLQKYYKTGEEIVKKFSTENITVVDPVDKNRDVSSIVSDGAIYRFMMAARAFLRKPSKKFFEKRKINAKEINEFMKKHANILCFSFKQPDIVDDIIWGQLRKLGKRIVRYLEDFDFSVLSHYIYSDGKKVVFLIESLENELPEKIPVMGPPANKGKDVERFKKSHKNAVLFLKNGRIVATEQRKMIKIENAVKLFLKKEKNLPSYLEKNLRKAKFEKAIEKKVLEGYFFWRKVFRE